MRILAAIAVSGFLLAGCGSSEIRQGSLIPQTPTSDKETAAPRAAGEHDTTDGTPAAARVTVLGTEDQRPAATAQLFPEARSALGTPVIWSTTGGPLPDSGRTKQVHIGANVTALPDWKRPTRWTTNNTEVSTGRTQDGERDTRVEEYLLPHMDDVWEPQGYENEPDADTPGLASFAVQPILRLARGTSEEHTAYALHAVALINTALPWNKRILIGPEAPPLVSVDAIPDGQIFVDFATKSDWIPTSEATALHAPRYEYEYDELSRRWEIRSMEAGHVWVDPSAFETQAAFVHVLAHELLHALGLRGHIFIHKFPQSSLRTPNLTTLPTDVHIPEIDADGLLAIYTRLEPGTDPEYLTADCLGWLCPGSLHPWDNESLRMHGELNTPDGASFGVAFRNDLGQPWARGSEPMSSLAENQEVSGSATWGGALLGFTPEGRSVTGLAEIGVDLAALTGRADFSDLQQWSSAKWQEAGHWSIWGDGDLGYTIAVRGNVFRETGGDHGVLTGVFVGKGHEGAIGTLERPDLSAAFGGSRTTTESDNCTVSQTAQQDCEARSPDLVPVAPKPFTSWSESEWVNIHTQWTGQAIQPLSWFGSNYQELFRKSGDSANIGEIGGVGDCFLQDSVFYDCYDNAEFIPFYQLETVSGNLVLLRARGKHGPDADRQDEEVGAVMGFTDWGYWAAGWSDGVGNVYDTLEKGEDRTLLQVFGPLDQFAVLYGDLGYEARERLEYLPYGDTWRASYQGLLAGIAHNHGGRPVWGRVSIGAEFGYDSWLSAVQISMTNIEGSNFTIDDIQFPRIDGDCCNERKENGAIAITSFELDRSDYFVKGEFIGPAHDAVHGVFSNGDVTGGFGALQTEAQNRPSLQAQ